MATNLLSYAGWYFLPNLVTGYLQSLLYTLTIRAGDPKPPPNSPRYLRDRRRIHIFVILAYLAYTVYEADYQLRQTPNFYQALGVPFSVDEKGIQSRFRRLTVQFHPDKLPANAGQGAREKAEAYYVHLKLARDTLVEPAKRFAYDRFGVEILGWRSCKTIKDFVMRGLQQTGGYYAASAAMLVLLGFLGYLRQGRYWRFWVMGALFVVELKMVVQPGFVSGLRVVNGFVEGTGVREPYLPFEMVVLLRKLAITFFIALQQLGPLLQDPNAGVVGEGDAAAAQQLDRLEAVARAADQEVSRLMGLELSPFVSERSTMRELRDSVKEWLVQNTIRNDPEVKAAVNQVLQRRRQEGSPPGPG